MEKQISKSQQHDWWWQGYQLARRMVDQLSAPLLAGATRNAKLASRERLRNDLTLYRALDDVSPRMLNAATNYPRALLKLGLSFEEVADLRQRNAQAVIDLRDSQPQPHSEMQPESERLVPT